MNCLSAPASTEVKQWIKVECFGQWTSYSIILLLIINVEEISQKRIVHRNGFLG